MMATTAVSNTRLLTDAQRSLLNSAGKQIAPTWPLDQMIAVNPFWEMRDKPIEQVAARLSTLAGAEMLMPADYYLALHEKGQITPEALRQAAIEQGLSLPEEALVIELRKSADLPHWHNLSDLLDSDRDSRRMPWRDEINHQISQFCAAHYQQLRQQAYGDGTEPGLYRHWLDVTRRDPGISIILDEAGFHRQFQQMPDDAESLLSECIHTLQLDDEILDAYAHALLLDINGWASWAAYLRWQGNLHDKPHDDMLQLLAIRMAWELAIWRYKQSKDRGGFQRLDRLWAREKQQLPELLQRSEQVNRLRWVWAKAAEISYQRALHYSLHHSC